MRDNDAVREITLRSCERCLTSCCRSLVRASMPSRLNEGVRYKGTCESKQNDDVDEVEVEVEGVG